MSRVPRSRSQRARWWLRGMWPDHNVLRRPTDRAETAVVALLLVLFLIGAPLTALVAGRWVADTGSRAAQAQRAARYEVPAVLLADAPYQAYALSDSLVRARWTAPDGQRRTGQVSAPVGARSGSRVSIWTDRAGHVTSEPIRPDQVTSQALLAALIAPVVLAFLLLSAGLLTHQVLERRRLAAWDEDWRATGPQWTRQR
jgi:hypothetical protein